MAPASCCLCFTQKRCVSRFVANDLPKAEYYGEGHGTVDVLVCWDKHSVNLDWGLEILTNSNCARKGAWALLLEKELKAFRLQKCTQREVWFIVLGLCAKPWTASRYGCENRLRFWFQGWIFYGWSKLLPPEGGAKYWPSSPVPHVWVFQLNRERRTIQTNLHETTRLAVNAALPTLPTPMKQPELHFTTLVVCMFLLILFYLLVTSTTILPRPICMPSADIHAKSCRCSPAIDFLPTFRSWDRARRERKSLHGLDTDTNLSLKIPALNRAEKISVCKSKDKRPQEKNGVVQHNTG